MNLTELYLAIDNLERRKRQANIEPTHILRKAELFKEIKYPPEEIEAALQLLLNDGRIGEGCAINDSYVYTK